MSAFESKPENNNNFMLAINGNETKIALINFIPKQEKSMIKYYKQCALRGLLYTALMLFYVPLALSVGQQWQRYPDNPVFLKGDLMKISSPCVLKEGKSYSMWYAGYWGAREIFLASSRNGINWQRRRGAVLARDVSKKNDGWNVLGHPCVIKDGEVYKMWYAGTTDWNSPGNIGYASSPNGVIWSKYPGNPVIQPENGENLSAPWVIKDGSGYKMWFIRIAKGDWALKVYYATSSDGIKWHRKTTPVMDGGAKWEGNKISSVCVIKDKSLYRMWYSAIGGDNKSRIGEAASTDGLNWKKSEKPLFPGRNPVVLWTESKGQMWYDNDDESSFSYAATGFDAVSKDITPASNIDYKNYELSPIEQDDDSPFGINCFQFPEMERKVGVKWLRLEIGWNLAEPEKGKFNWEKYDKMVRQARENNIKIMGVLNGTAKWASTAPAGASASYWHTYPPRDFKDFANYVRTVVSRYKNDIQYWEVWNEPDLPYSWRGNIPTFVKLLKIAYTEAKKANPNCKIAAMALCGGFDTFINSVLDNGGGKYFDICSDHTYGAEAPLITRIRQIKQILRKRGEEKPIWVTEAGCNSRIEKKTGEPQEQEDARWEEALKDQADVIVKGHVGLLSEGVERIFTYQASRVGSRYEHENFGLLDENGCLAPAGVAYHIMVSMLAGAKYITELKYGSDTVAYVFMKKGKAIVCMWSLKDEDIAINTGSNSVEVTNLSGITKHITATNGSVLLNVNKSPVFICGMNQNLLLLKEKVAFSKRDLKLVPGQNKNVFLQVANPRKSAIAIGIKLWSTPGCKAETVQRIINLKPEESVKIPISVYLANSAKTGIYRVTATVDYGQGNGKVETLLQVHTVPPLEISATPVELDMSGDLQLEVKIFNRSAETLTGTISPVTGFKAQCNPASNSFSKLPSGSLKKFLFTIKPEGPISNYSRITMLAQIKNGPLVKEEIPMDFIPCAKITSQPEMNGNMRAYGTASFAWLDKPGQYVRLMTNGPAGEWHGINDLSGRIMSAWNNNYLYLAVAVTDDKHHQPYSGSGPVFDGDSIQIGIDTLNNKSIIYDNDDYEIALSLSAKGPELTAYVAPLGGDGLKADAELSITRRGKDLVYEVGIPWKSLGLTPVPGQKIGLSLLVNDNDGKGRKGFIQWTEGVGQRKEPKKFGTLVLLP